MNKVHTVTPKDGETLEDAFKRTFAEAEASEQAGDFNLTILEGILEMQGVVEHLYDFAEKKLGRKPIKKQSTVPLLGGLLLMPVNAVDPDDTEWFAAMGEGLRALLGEVGSIDLAKV